jgi:hypothetical protein
LASTCCAYAVARTARASGLGPPWLAVLFLFVQPFFLAHAGTAMTEPWAAALFAWMLLAVVEERHRLLIALAAILPLARMEAMVFWPLVVAYEWQYPSRSWLGLLPLPVCGLAMLGALTSHDPLWLLHQSRLTAYPEREALHYVKSWVWTLGLGLFAPALLGLIGAVHGAGRSRSEMAPVTRRALVASALATIVLLIVYSALAAWRPVLAPDAQRDIARSLESGSVLVLPRLGFAMSESERRFLSPRVEGISHVGQQFAQLCGAIPKRLPRGIQIKPKLVLATQLRIAAQIVEHFHPGNGAGPQAMDH